VPSLTSMVRQLKKDNESLQARAEQLDAALKAMGSLGSCAEDLDVAAGGQKAADHTSSCA
jgi:hypothetical protein